MNDFAALYDQAFNNLALTKKGVGGFTGSYIMPASTSTVEDSQETEGLSQDKGPAPGAGSFIAFIDGLGLNHFSGASMSKYFTRVNKGGANTVPPRELWPNIVQTLAVVQEIANTLGGRVIISSSYRAPGYNRGVGGATNSYHMQFKALDLNITGASPGKVAALAKSLRGQTFMNPYTKKPFKFAGGVGTYPNFTHIDCRGSNINW